MSDDVLQLVQVVARRRDGALDRHVVAAREAEFGGDFYACLTGWTIHPSHEEGTEVTPFEECVESAMVCFGFQPSAEP